MTPAMLVTVLAVLAIGANPVHGSLYGLYPEPEWQGRSLKQGPPDQCPGCVKPNFQCRLGGITCLAGTPGINLEQQADCSTLSTQSIPSSCLPTPFDDGVDKCPKAKVSVTTKICSPGIGLAGYNTNASACDVCYNFTLTGSCDVDEDGKPRTGYGRTNLTCANVKKEASYSTIWAPAFRCTVGEVIDFGAMGCTLTSAVDPNGGEASFWWNTDWKALNSTTGATYTVKTLGVALGNYRPQKLNCTAFLNTNFCAYTIYPASTNGCSTYLNGRLQFYIMSTSNNRARTIANNGALANPGNNPAGCPMPYL